MPVRIGIMGFGRIGKNIFRQAYERKDVEIVAISDLGTPESLAYLLEFDTVYGRFPGEVELEGRYLKAGNQRARVLKGARPEDMPWEAYDADIVIESTGTFRHAAELQGHIDSGAKAVILTTPAIDEIDRTIVHGLNEDTLTATDRIVSCASTTVHALGTMIKVLDEAVGVEQAMMTTVHAYSSDQQLADAVTADLRRSRSAAENLIPNENWSPNMVEFLMPHLKGKLDGMAINVPVPNGSNLDLSTQLKRSVTKDEVNEIVRSAAENGLSQYLQYATEPIVSRDVIGNEHSVVFDSLATIALEGGLVKTIGWYDNGWGYASRLIDTALAMGDFVK
jgi:glyceraldehyde 3-phosphate dehydrogenase